MSPPSAMFRTPLHIMGYRTSCSKISRHGKRNGVTVHLPLDLTIHALGYQ